MIFSTAAILHITTSKMQRYCLAVMRSVCLVVQTMNGFSTARLHDRTTARLLDYSVLKTTNLIDVCEK